MPEAETKRRAEQDRREGKAPTTQAGEFVREEFHHIREGKHGARSAKQAIAIGLSKARRAGVKLGAPKRGSAKMKKQAARDTTKGQSRRSKRPSAKRSKATTRALKRESRSAGSHRAISRAVRSQPRSKRQTSRSRSRARARK